MLIFDYNITIVMYGGENMSKEAMIIAILVALMILWLTETLGMHKTSKVLSGVIDLGFAILR